MNKTALINVVAVALGIPSVNVVDVAPAVNAPNYGQWVQATLTQQDPVTSKVSTYTRNVNVTDVTSLAVRPLTDDDLGRAVACRGRDWIGYSWHDVSVRAHDCMSWA